ncbi:hypothetical protein K461DRAFT_37546 [Myriangium duriaei CBS 260.36]|uniref:Uncharacterized protein n=1 Tax=Myriangium duriaei CBS 260.36 TaxID=1168546 RepID=A0A9P4IU11_9PEZI|nr:hypothetical protein K461DRAFT_37546 [Myriangium duriaei CBS 260.36]
MIQSTYCHGQEASNRAIIDSVSHDNQIDYSEEIFAGRQSLPIDTILQTALISQRLTLYVCLSAMTVVEMEYLGQLNGESRVEVQVRDARLHQGLDPPTSARGAADVVGPVAVSRNCQTSQSVYVKHKIPIAAVHRPVRYGGEIENGIILLLPCCIHHLSISKSCCCGSESWKNQ